MRDLTEKLKSIKEGTIESENKFPLSNSDQVLYAIQNWHA